jgi:hypothetical protein
MDNPKRNTNERIVINNLADSDPFDFVEDSVANAVPTRDLPMQELDGASPWHESHAKSYLAEVDRLSAETTTKRIYFLAAIGLGLGVVSVAISMAAYFLSRQPLREERVAKIDVGCSVYEIEVFNEEDATIVVEELTINDTYHCELLPWAIQPMDFREEKCRRSLLRFVDENGIRFQPDKMAVVKYKIVGMVNSEPVKYEGVRGPTSKTHHI